MKGIYLASYMAYHPYYHLVYQDINGKRDISGDMLDIDLSTYDYVIATPPCNWWSRANYRRNSSEYALKTKHLLIDILHKLKDSHIPFIVENVRNSKFFKEYGLFDLGLYVYIIGRHTYWTNIHCPLLNNIIQKPKIDIVNGKKRYLSSQNLPGYARQGGDEVHQVVDTWLYYLHSE